MNALRWLFGWLTCQHTWVLEREVQDYNLRGNFAHKSSVFYCSKCGKREVREHPPS